MRRLWWVLAIGAAVGVYAILHAAVTGHFTERQQIHFIARLVIYAMAGGFALTVLISSTQHFRASCAWAALGVGFRNWTAFFPFLSLIVLFGGWWSWIGYFGDHGAFFIWPLIVGVVFLLLIVIDGLVHEHLQKLYNEEATKLPDIVNESGASNPEDFKDWKK